jgi:hypothetical protein
MLAEIRYRSSADWANGNSCLYGCETWSLTLTKEHGVRMVENRVIRIFGSMGEEVTGGWR